MKHLMPVLPYEMGALSPMMSEETMQYHYGKHLQAYVNNLNALVPGTLYEEMSLEEIVCKASGAIFNNAAQAWNHTFFFEALAPRPGEMGEGLKKRLLADFGSLEAFEQQYMAAAAGLFGAGWAWLVLNEKRELAIVQTVNAGNPMTEGMVPLLTIDVWEHAYYIDYRNRRADYLKAVWQLVDWKTVSERYENAINE